MPGKKKLIKRKVTEKKSSSNAPSKSSSGSSGKIKAFKKPGLILKEKTQAANPIIGPAKAAAAFTAGAILAAFLKKNKDKNSSGKNEDDSFTSIRQQINRAKSETFRECKEEEMSRLAALNEKNEKNTRTLSENQKTINELTAEKNALTARVESAKKEIRDITEKCRRTKQDLDSCREKEGMANFMKNFR